MTDVRFFVWRVTALAHLPGDLAKRRLVVTIVDHRPSLLTENDVLLRGLEKLLEGEQDEKIRAQITSSASVEEVSVGQKYVFLFQ